MSEKRVYEAAEIEIIPLGESDIVSSSSAFDGEDDYITSEW